MSKSTKGPKQGSAQSNQSVRYSKDQAAITGGATLPTVPAAKTKLAELQTKGIAEPKSRRNVVAENKAATAKATRETNKRKPTQTQNKPGMVVGHPTTPLYKGPKATPRSIAGLASANRGADTVAILNDGSTHPVTRMVGAGLKITVGMVFSAVCAKYAELQAAEDTRRQAAPKGPAVLAKGAEGEVHSRKAAHDSRKGEPVAKAPAPVAKAPAKAAPKGGKNKQPSAGLDFTYKPGKAFDRKAGTWTEYMVNLIRANKDTGAAKAAHAKGKSYTDKKLDFSWCVAQGFIKR